MRPSPARGSATTPSPIEKAPGAGRDSGVVRRAEHRTLALLHAVTDAQARFLAEPDTEPVLLGLLGRIADATGSTAGMLGRPGDAPADGHLDVVSTAGVSEACLSAARPFLLRAWRENSPVVVVEAPPGDGPPPPLPLIALPFREASRTIGVLCLGGFAVPDMSGIQEDLKALSATFASLVVAQRNLRQKRTFEAELRAQEQRYNLLVQGAGDGIWVWEVGKQEIHCSDITRVTLGYGLHEFVFTFDFWIDLLHPDDREAVLSALAAYVEGREPLDIEMRLRAKDGQYLWFRTMGQARWVDASGAIRVAGSFTDITARRAVDQKLREGEARIRAIVDRAADGIVTIDEEGLVESFNPSAERMFGYAAREVVGSSIQNLLFDPLSSGGLARRFAANTSIPGYEVVGRRKDGGEFPAEVSISAVILGERRLVTALVRDVGERKRLEQRTAAQHAVTKLLSQAESIGEAAEGAVAALGGGLSWDLAALWLSSPPEKLLRCAAAWGADPAGAERFRRVSQSMSFAPGSGVLGGVWLSGEPLWLDSVPSFASPERAALARQEGLASWLVCPILVRGEILGVIELFSRKHLPRDDQLVDVVKAAGSQIGQFVERKQAEDALRVAKDVAEQASRAKTEFLANVSHEIRTPLNAILGAADLLWESKLDDEQRQYLSLFRRAGGNLLALVNDLLDLSKVEAGQLELKNVVFDVREVVAQALESTAASAYEKGLEMVGRIRPRVRHMVSGDPARLRQVLVNLLSNAVKFTNHGEVMIDVDRDPESDDPGALLFSVRDTGIGIAADKLDAIFERFAQVDASSTRIHGGTGLGLAICRRLVEMMGGRIWAESVVGAGTVFHFTIRCAAADGQVAHPAWSASSVSLGAVRGPLRVLVADDHPATRAYLVEVLRDAGCVVTDFGTGAEALACIESAERAGTPFDVLVLDAEIDRSDGVNVAEWLRRTTRRAASCVLLLPADAKPHEMSAVREMGFASYVLKPALPHRITKAVALACRNANSTPSAAPAAETDTMNVRSLDILLVEDHPDNRLILTSYLKHLPHRVTIAESGEAAVAAFQNGSFHIVLMDMQMPVMDGYEATRRIRAFEREQGRKPTPIVALTAYVLQEEIERTRLAGCDAHLGKPISKASFLAALQEHAARTTREDEALFATIDPDLLDLVPGYIQNRFRDVAACREHLEHGRFEEVRVIAHGMAGSGGAYGFAEITRIGRALQVAARDVDARACGRAIDELDAYVRRIDAAYGQ